MDFRKKFLLEMTLVSEAVQNAFHPLKINCESLGNSSPHVHWHIIPRYKIDPAPYKAIWGINRNVIDSVILSDNELKDMKNILQSELEKVFS